MAYAFSGTAKTITLSAGTVALDLVDLHSRWKDWVLAGNAQFPVAFRAVGGDIPAIPLYLFLLDGWRIVPQQADHTLTVTDGILEVDGGGDPFVDPAGSYKIRINRQTPGIAIGYSTTGGNSSDIADAVWQRVLEDGLSAEALQRIMLAALVGKTAGIGSASETYLAQDGTTPRIVASFDQDNNRTSVTLDGAA